MKFGPWKFYKVGKEENKQQEDQWFTELTSFQETLNSIYLSLRKGLFTTLFLAPRTSPSIVLVGTQYL